VLSEQCQILGMFSEHSPATTSHQSFHFISRLPLTLSLSKSLHSDLGPTSQMAASLLGALLGGSELDLCEMLWIYIPNVAGKGSVLETQADLGPTPQTWLAGWVATRPRLSSSLPLHTFLKSCMIFLLFMFLYSVLWHKDVW